MLHIPIENERHHQLQLMTIWLLKELEATRRASYVQLKDAQILSECVSSMGQRRNNVAGKVAPIKLRSEKCALGTGQ
jgi:hypothetical protein